MKVFVENRDRRIDGGKRSALAVDPHYHPHFEIIYILSGRALISIDGCVYDLREDDLVVVLPHQVHHIQDVTHGESYLFIFPHNICEEYQELCSHALPVSPVIHRISRQPRLHELLTVACDNLEKEQPFQREILKGLLIIILGITFRQMEFTSRNSDTTDIFRQMVRYCTENFDQPISLDSLAEQFYLSRYQVSRMFTRNLNTGFSKFLSGIRVMEACRLLEQDVPITETAVRSGFASIRSFNRCFMEQTGLTPRQYKGTHTVKNALQ